MYSYDETTNTLTITDDDGKYHSKCDLPAYVEIYTGKCMWYKHGDLHRGALCGPAVIIDANIKKTQVYMMNNKVTHVRFGGSMYILNDNDLTQKMRNMFAGSIQSGLCKNGKQVGIWKYGTLSELAIIFDDSGTHYRLSSCTGTFDIYTSKKTSTIDPVHRNVYKTETRTYKDGKREGHQVTYDEHGNKVSEYTMKSDKMDGLYQKFNEEGTMIEHGEYVNGKYKKATLQSQDDPFKVSASKSIDIDSDVEKEQCKPETKSLFGGFFKRA